MELCQFHAGTQMIALMLTLLCYNFPNSQNTRSNINSHDGKILWNVVHGVLPRSSAAPGQGVYKWSPEGLCDKVYLAYRILMKY